MRRFNVLNGELARDDDDPPGYGGRYAHVARAVGTGELSVNVFVLEPGQSLCPYHYEYVEEWMIVLDGELAVRDPQGTHPLCAGDAVCFPRGPEGAHKITNDSARDARLVMFSSAALPAVAVYPDSDKLLVIASAEERLIVRRNAGVGYWDGESTAP